MANMLRVLVEEVNIEKWMDSTSRQKETPRKNKQEMLETNNTLTVKNVFSDK
jgi:hypothetical protein